MALGVLVLVSIGGAGCSSDKTASEPNGSAAVGGSQPVFTLSEWKISLDGTISSGPVTVTIDNKGGEKHELVIVVAADVASLPRKADGSVDEDKIPEKDKLGEAGGIAARTSTSKTFTFAPGTYVAFCNLTDSMGMTGSTMMGASNGPMMGSGSSPSNASMGHVHFALGMHATFTVTG